MANNQIINRIYDWITDFGALYNFNVKKLTWGLDLTTAVYDYEFRIIYNSIEISSRGTANSKEVAFIKGFSELVERATLAQGRFKSSNGIACHTSNLISKKKAKNELLERDLFLYSFYGITNTNFHKLSHFKEITSYLNDEFGVETKLYSFGLEQERTFCYIMHSRNNEHPIGLVSGFSYGAETYAVLEQAFFECLRKAAHRIENYRVEIGNQISLSNFVRLGPNAGLRDHENLTWNEEYKEIIVNRLSEMNSKKTHNPTQGNFDVKITKLEVPNSFNKLSFFVSRASCCEVQDLFWGNLTENKLNMNRYSNISEFQETIKTNFIPHFLI